MSVTLGYINPSNTRFMNPNQNEHSSTHFVVSHVRIRQGACKSQESFNIHSSVIQRSCKSLVRVL